MLEKSIMDRKGDAMSVTSDITIETRMTEMETFKENHNYIEDIITLITLARDTNHSSDI